MPKVYFYVIARDFGFAPNPFHGTCTLATCKPRIRKSAQEGDWIFGMGGSRLRATGRCIMAMRVCRKMTFSEYWNAPEFRCKRPVRNGSRKMLLGDNIYCYDEANERWNQADSHHSNADGSANLSNMERDTSSQMVLVSDHFYYFGSNAIAIPPKILVDIGYKNPRDYCIFDANTDALPLLRWLEREHGSLRNRVCADPFDFSNGAARYSVHTDAIT